MWAIHKKIESHGKGSPEDGSEEWEDSISFHLVRSDEEEEFQESLANDYGYQDYHYRISCKKVAEFRSDEELKELVKIINKRLNKEE